jgi:hypothetical protein
MVFLIQATQNRDTLALQIKLSELILALEGARNELAAVERQPEGALRDIADDIRERSGVPDDPPKNLGLLAALVLSARLLGPLDAEESQQRERNEAAPAKGAGRLHHGRQHSRIGQGRRQTSAPCSL